MAKAKSAAAKLVSGKVSKSKSDVLSGIAAEVENLSKAKTFSMIDDLIARAGEDDFRLGGLLAVTHDKCKAGEKSGKDSEWLDGKKSFHDLVVERFQFTYRKAMYLIAIYKDLTEKQIPWAAVKDVGWAKLIILSSVLTQKNVDGWVEKALKYNVEALREIVAKAHSKGSDAAEKGGTSDVTSLTFKLHKDQKVAVKEALKKAKKETATEFDSVALFNISQGYLGNSVQIEIEQEEQAKEESAKSQKGKLKSLMQSFGPLEVLSVFDQLFPEWFIKVKTPEMQSEEKAEASEHEFKYDPDTFEVDLVKAQSANAKAVAASA